MREARRQNIASERSGVVTARCPTPYCLPAAPTPPPLPLTPSPSPMRQKGGEGGMEGGGGAGRQRASRSIVPSGGSHPCCTRALDTTRAFMQLPCALVYYLPKISAPLSSYTWSTDALMCLFTGTLAPCMLCTAKINFTFNVPKLDAYTLNCKFKIHGLGIYVYRF